MFTNECFSINSRFIFRHSRRVFKKEYTSKKHGFVCIISGVSLLFFYFIALIVDVRVPFLLQILLTGIVVVSAIYSTTIREDKPVSSKLSDRQKYTLNWRFPPFFIIVHMVLCLLFWEVQPVKMDNGLIYMDRAFGYKGVFNLADIQSVDSALFDLKSDWENIRKGWHWFKNWGF